MNEDSSELDDDFYADVDGQPAYTLQKSPAW